MGAAVARGKQNSKEISKIEALLFLLVKNNFT